MEENTPASKWLVRILIAVVILIGGTVAIGVQLVRNYEKNAQGVLVEVSGSEEVTQGVPFDLQVKVKNNTDTILKNTKMEIRLPQVFAVVVSDGGKTGIVEDSLGNVGVGNEADRTYKIIGLNASTSTEKVVFIVSYGSEKGGKFEKREEYTRTIKSSPVKLGIKIPNEIHGGERFDLVIEYQNESSEDFSNVVLEAKYPNAFRFISANLTPDSLNNEWRLGALKARSSGNLTIKGSFDDSIGGARDMTFILENEIAGERYELARIGESAKSAAPIITLTTEANGAANNVVRVGSRLRYVVRYQNTSNTPLHDVVIKASLVGEMFDASSLETSGRIESNGVVIWDGVNAPALEVLDPGAKGEVSMEVSVRPTFITGRLNDRNFILKMNVQAESPSVPLGASGGKTHSSTKSEIKIVGLSTIETQALYRDAESGIVNNGSVPPAVGKTTQYSVHWIIRNYATDVRDVKIKTTLEPNVKWTGSVKSNVGTVPKFNRETDEIVWEIDRIPATKGVIGKPYETIFQVEITPQSNQIGQIIPLIKDTLLEAQDEFTGETLKSSDSPITTMLTDDPTVTQNDGTVVP